MNFLINILIFFWFIRTAKSVLFWIYLWQLKSYHIGRFLDHFKTHKGKKILFNPLLLTKLLLCFLLFIDYYAALSILLIIYGLEFSFFIIGIIKKQVKKPVATVKAIFLIGVVFLDVIGYFYFSYLYAKNSPWFIFAMLAYDICIPLIVSLIVLFFQPFFVMLRNNTLKKAKSKMAKCKNLTVIGITGSYGKTSTKEFLTTILSSKFRVLKTPEHKNSEIGIAQTILSKDFDRVLNQETGAPFSEGARPNTKKDLSVPVFIVEMGAYNKGGIKLLCDIVKPTIGIVTGVNEQHLATFGSLENLLSAEGGQELANSLPKDGLIVLNGDNKYCLDLYKKTTLHNKKLYSVDKNVINSDIWTESIEVTKDSVSFIAMSRAKEMAHFTVSVLGKQNVQNLLGAILVARELKMSFEEIAKACNVIAPQQSGMTLKSGIHRINIIDSSYSSNPDGVVADLDYLNIFKGKKVIVMPCLIELGDKSAEVHYQIGKKIAKVCDMAIITTKDQFENIKKGAIENGMSPNKVLLIDKLSDIVGHITTFCKEGDTVLLEGRVPNEVIKLL